MYHVGLIGDPVAHSRSPMLHNRAFAYIGLEAEYLLWHTKTDELPARIESLRQASILGANVTLPHKLAVIPLLDDLEPEAATIGAVNTIYKRPDGALVGANTDATACVDTIRHDGNMDVAGATVVVLGASGAARAAAAALGRTGIAELIVVNRTIERAAQLLVEIFPQSITAKQPILRALALSDRDAVLESIARSNLLINATSMGWHEQELPLPEHYFPLPIRGGTLVFDMIYRPTRLLHEAAQYQARTLDGMGMLIRQGALAFERWTGQVVPLSVFRQAVPQS